jgi:hypothetical protein
LKRNIAVAVGDRIVRYILINFFAKKLPLFIVTEYPKSGGSWFSQMLADYLNISFPRNRIPLPKSCIMHGHYLYSKKKLPNVFVVIRDGRDVIVSFYFHCFFINDRFNERLVIKMRNLQPYKDFRDIKKNLPLFIDFLYKTKKPLGFTWSDFVNNWYGKQGYFIRYEKLKEECAIELYRAIQSIIKTEPENSRLKDIATKYTFAAQAKRKPGDEKNNSFMRKGIVGDWKNYFTKETSEIFDYYAGKELILLGYEKDRTWIELTLGQ